MHKLLLVEDETVIRAALKRLLEHHGYRVKEAKSVEEAQNKYDINEFNLIISDLRLPGAPGTELIRATDKTPVLIMTSYASLRSAVDSMKLGAVDYIAKPFDNDEMLATVAQIIERNPLSDTETVAGAAINGIIGSCTPMKKLIAQLHKIAPTDSTVLIQGETGTGKELLARALHARSGRANKPMVCVNCAAIPETLIESELFGYEKGAFTGANSNRSGLIEAADGGTLFLDEIGELPLEAQARLLRFIQEGEIRRIGATQSITVDVRLISATHRDLKSLAHTGGFRQDLFYRINVLCLELPPLRARGKDILAVADAVLARKCQELHQPLKHLAPPTIQAVMSYNWPGNVRELENALERAVVLAEQEEIDVEALGIDFELVPVEALEESPYGKQRIKPQRSSTATKLDPSEDLSLEEYFQRFVLEHQDQMSETELAKKLGVSRKCLWERRQRFGIHRDKSASTKARQSKSA